MRRNRNFFILGAAVFNTSLVIWSAPGIFFDFNFLIASWASAIIMSLYLSFCGSVNSFSALFSCGNSVHIQVFFEMNLPTFYYFGLLRLKLTLFFPYLYVDIFALQVSRSFEKIMIVVFSIIIFQWFNLHFQLSFVVYFFSFYFSVACFVLLFDIISIGVIKYFLPESSSLLTWILQRSW